MKLAFALVVVAGCGRLGFEHLPVRDGDGAVAPGDVLAPNPAACPVVDDGANTIVSVSTVAELETAVMTAAPNTSILLAAGEYVLTTPLVITQPLLTLRAADKSASSVTLRASGAFSPMIHVRASYVTLAHLTVTDGSAELVVVEASTANIIGNRIHDVTFRNAGNTRFRARPLVGNVTAGPYSDDGSVTCSRFVPEGPTAGCTFAMGSAWAISGDAARGWTIANNVFDWRACSTRTFRTVVFDSGSRDSEISNNVFVHTNHGILLGGATPSRTYPDALPATCSGTPDHWGGLICNNVIVGEVVVPDNAGFDFKEGIAAWTTCETWIMHNTIASPLGEAFSTLEYRFPETYVHFVNNVTREPIAQRDMGEATLEGTHLYQSNSEFRDAVGGDLRFAGTPPTGAPIDRCLADIDGKPRSASAPHVGAYEL